MFNKIYTVVGARSQGKTPFILGGDYEQGIANIYLKKGMSVLIIDEVDHPKYRHVPFLHPNNYSVLSKEPKMYRTLASIDNMPLLMEKIKSVWNTLIVFEDCHKYFGRRFTKNEIAIIGNSKNQNNCIIFMHWSWGFIQLDLFRMSNYFVIFKTGDTPLVRKNYIHGYFEQALKAYEYSISPEKKFPYKIVATGI